MDHLISDPRGYWRHVVDIDLATRLSVLAERKRWRAVLANYVSSETLRHITQQVLDAVDLLDQPGHEQQEEVRDGNQ